MQISPPIATMIILAIGVAATVWLAPPQREPAQATVTLPMATYQKLAELGKARAGADGRPLSVTQLIEEIANERGTQD